MARMKRIKADLNYFIRACDYSVDVLGLCSVLWAMSCRADLRRGFPHTAGSLLPSASADGDDYSGFAGSSVGF